MRERVDFQRKTFRQPGLKLRIGRWRLITHDAHRAAAIDLLERFEHRPQISLVFGCLTQVVDRDDDDRLDSFLTDPLWRREPRQAETRIKRIVAVQIS